MPPGDAQLDQVIGVEPCMGKTPPPTWECVSYACRAIARLDRRFNFWVVDRVTFDDASLRIEQRFRNTMRMRLLFVSMLLLVICLSGLALVALSASRSLSNMLSPRPLLILVLSTPLLWFAMITLIVSVRPDGRRRTLTVTETEATIEYQAPGPRPHRYSVYDEGMMIDRRLLVTDHFTPPGAPEDAERSIDCVYIRFPDTSDAAVPIALIRDQLALHKDHPIAAAMAGTHAYFLPPLKTQDYGAFVRQHRLD